MKKTCVPELSTKKSTRVVWSVFAETNPYKNNIEFNYLYIVLLTINLRYEFVY